LSARLLEANLEILKVLGSAIAKRDSDTDAHNYRVTIYAVRLAEHVGLPVPEIQSLIKGAFLHDVGKIGIRDDVLLKPGRLTEDESAVMRQHVDHGVDIVCRAAWLQDALAVVASHHEQYDGAGYPRRMPGEEIPQAARIFAIVDVFDALLSARPYKEAMPLWRVVQTLQQGRGTHFDPYLLDRFLEIAPTLQEELAPCSTGQLRGAVQAINERYFVAAPETVLV
jgi:putative nucleotidyltransferase with HDIG domain